MSRQVFDAPTTILKKSPSERKESPFLSRSGTGASTGDSETVIVPKASTGPALSALARKAEAETETFRVPRVTVDMRVAIQQARVAKGLTQAQLAKLINKKVQVIQDYENGSAVLQPNILSEICRVLGIKRDKKASKSSQT